MEKQQSRNRRLKRRKFILKMRDFIISIFIWLKINVTFKKSIVVFCISYIVKFIEYLKKEYQNGGIFPEEIAIAVITAFVGELTLTCISSIKDKDEDEGGDEDFYG